MFSCSSSPPTSTCVSAAIFLLSCPITVNRLVNLHRFSSFRELAAVYVGLSSVAASGALCSSSALVDLICVGGRAVGILSLAVPISCCCLIGYGLTQSRSAAKPAPSIGTPSSCLVLFLWISGEVYECLLLTFLVDSNREWLDWHPRVPLLMVANMTPGWIPCKAYICNCTL